MKKLTLTIFDLIIQQAFYTYQIVSIEIINQTKKPSS